MDGRAWNHSRHRPLQLIAHSLGRTEDNDPRAVAFIPDDFLDKRILFSSHIVNHFDNLGNIFIRNQSVSVADVHDGRVRQKFTGKLSHFSRPRCSKEQSLPLRPARHDISRIGTDKLIKPVNPNIAVRILTGFAARSS